MRVKRFEPMTISITKEEKEDITRTAKVYGMNVSALIRQIYWQWKDNEDKPRTTNKD